MEQAEKIIAGVRRIVEVREKRLRLEEAEENPALFNTERNHRKVDAMGLW